MIVQNAKPQHISNKINKTRVLKPVNRQILKDFIQIQPTKSAQNVIIPANVVKAPYKTTVPYAFKMD